LAPAYPQIALVVRAKMRRQRREVILMRVLCPTVVLAQPGVQRTRLRRSRTVAAKSKGFFACRVSGRLRRAADAIVRAKEESHP